MDLWKSAMQAAEKAKSVAKVMSRKGMDFAEATAEEAGKKLKDLGLSDRGAKAQEVSEEELEAYGVTPDFLDFIRSLNYATMRDFPADHLAPLNAAAATAAAAGEVGAGEAAAAAAAAAAQRLNPWQVRHATLVVEAVKEVNELRYVLCPRYMTDEHFWHVYFTISRRHLPEAAFAWKEGDALPYAAPPGAGGEEGFSLAALGSQLKQLSSRLQQPGQSAGAGPSNVELSSLPPSAAGGGAAAAPAPPPKPAALLETDPDLEAYLRVAIADGQDSECDSEGGDAGGEAGGERGGGDEEEEDDDLDQYLTALSAEVEAAETEGNAGGWEGEAGDDVEDDGGVDAALRALAEGEDKD